MANRAYLYSLSNRPESYADRPETISGLSEWPYAVPFSYRAIMSGHPQICASLISEGFDGEEQGKKSRIFAISGDFAVGYARVKRLCNALRAVASSAPELLAAIDPMLAFLDAHRNTHLLLETIELDMMTAEEDEAALRVHVEQEATASNAASPATTNQTMQLTCLSSQPLSNQKTSVVSVESSTLALDGDHVFFAFAGSGCGEDYAVSVLCAQGDGGWVGGDAGATP
jgi:hypothetical protein